ncbi:hypothetical protein [Clostridium thailandense]|uniref:hypothetical protein n=1 Tax=Clostridium thailandense TaxID=2794346 RepID=UPI0039899E54
MDIKYYLANIIILLALSAKWYLMINSFFKRKSLGTVLIKLKNKCIKKELAKCVLYFSVPVIIIISQFRIYLEDLKIAEKIHNLQKYNVNIDYSLYPIEQTIYLVIIVAIYIITYLFEHLSNHYIYEKGVSNILWTIQWNEISKYNIEDTYIKINAIKQWYFFKIKANIFIKVNQFEKLELTNILKEHLTNTTLETI